LSVRFSSLTNSGLPPAPSCAYQAAKPVSASFNAAVCPGDGDPAVRNLLVPIRQKHHLPAMAAAIVTSKGLVTSGGVGIRKPEATSSRRGD
jgi:hypothetical protein